MVRTAGKWDRDRLTSVAGVAAVHAAIGYALIVGLGFEVMRAPAETLKLFDIAPEPPPPPPVEEIIPPKARTEASEGAAAPPGLKARPTPVVAPPPKVRLPVPSPVIVAPVAGPGIAPSAGASDIAGPGTGAGGEGEGTGSGGAGSGAGGGGPVTRPRYVSGRLVNSDYPRGARDAEGSVTVEFTVETDGRVSECQVTESSGNADLDTTTCRLIERRFRYDPARDAEGRAVADVTGWRQDWWIGRRRRASAR